MMLNCIVVSFFPVTYTVTEGEDTTVELVLIRSGDLSRPTAIEVTTLSGSANGICTSVKIIKNEVGCRDDTVPKTVDTRRHCEED